MVESIKVLIVDDDKTWQTFLAAALQDCDVKVASNAFAAEELALEWLPDVVLLDIEMPIKNGYHVCKDLKARDQTRDIPVIFVSGASSLQEKIAGFELGAEDYLVKPCEAALLSAKVKRSAAQYRERRELGERAISAQISAFEAMNSSADLGRSLRFAERTYVMNSYDKLAEGLFQTMEEFGLETSVMFITESEPLFYSHNQREMSPLEQDMFTAVHPEGRFADFGKRTFCNFKLISLLIKNMPLDDPERYGRIKDSIPWILGTADGKVGALNLHNRLARQHEQVAASVDHISRHLHSFEQTFIHSNQVVASHVAVLYSSAQSGKSAVTGDTSALANHGNVIPAVAAAEAYQALLDQFAVNNQLADKLSGLLRSLAQLADEQEQVNRLILQSAAPELTELGSNEIFSSGVDFF